MVYVNLKDFKAHIILPPVKAFKCISRDKQMKKCDLTATSYLDLVLFIDGGF
jgi:hypothetical protein